MSRQISVEGAKLLEQFMKWAESGTKKVDPHLALRELSLADLSVVCQEIEGDLLAPSDPVSTMLGVEMAYRLGKLKEDWHFTVEDNTIRIHVQPVPGVTEVVIHRPKKAKPKKEDTL